jgi:lactate dehydrogenase-like 2-hydroxyacid dehydrogenase
MPPMAIELIAERATPVIAPPGPDGDAAIAREAAEIRAIVLGRTVDAAFLSRFPRLGLVANMGVGYDNVPVAWCARNGILVSHTPHVLSDDVADTAVALALMTIRRFGEAERYLRAGHWGSGAFPLTDSLAGRRVGILGFGRIGRAVARRLGGFEVSVAYHDVVADEGSGLTRHADAEALARESDVLICVLPGGPATRGLVDARILRALGPSGYLVNVGRGTAVDQPALIAALTAGTIAGAGLDVYESEPDLPPELLALERVVLLPHVASASHRTREGMARLVAANVFEFLETGRAVSPVPETPNPSRE